MFFCITNRAYYYFLGNCYLPHNFCRSVSISKQQDLVSYLSLYLQCVKQCLSSRKCSKLYVSNLIGRTTITKLISFGNFPVVGLCAETKISSVLTPESLKFCLGVPPKQFAGLGNLPCRRHIRGQLLERQYNLKGCVLCAMSSCLL